MDNYGLENLTKIYSSFLTVETKGYSTIIMASTLQSLEKYIIDLRNSIIKSQQQNDSPANESEGDLNG